MEVTTDQMCKKLLEHAGMVFSIDDQTPDREVYDALEKKSLIRYRQGMGDKSPISVVYTEEGLELFKMLSV